MREQIRNIAAIAKVTALEIARNRILYNALVFAGLLFCIGYLASGLSYTNSERILIDFGISGIQLASGLAAILAGGSILGREIERKTLGVVLARPVSRMTFLSGKFAGLASVLLLNWAVLCGALLATLSIGGALQMTQPLAWAMVLIYFQSLMLAAFALLFSSFSTSSLSIALTIGLYLIGTNVSQLRILAKQAQMPLSRDILLGVAQLIPNFEYFSVGFRVDYGLTLPNMAGATGITYSLALSLGALIVAGLVLERRDI